jgi:hypothetical protein
MRPHLFRGRRHARHGLAVLRDRSQIADDENLWMSGRGEIGIDQHAPGAVERHVERARQRRGRHTGRPDHGIRAHEFSADAITIGTDLRHR